MNNRVESELREIREILVQIRSDKSHKKYYSVKEISNIIGISKTTWWSWVQKGIAPQPIRICNITRWNCAEVDNFLTKNQNTGRKEDDF